MTKDELIAKFTELAASDDPEMAHIVADDWLIDYVAPHPNDPIRLAYDAIGKWYA